MLDEIEFAFNTKHRGRVFPNLKPGEAGIMSSEARAAALQAHFRHGYNFHRSISITRKPSHSEYIVIITFYAVQRKFIGNFLENKNRSQLFICRMSR